MTPSSEDYEDQLVRESRLHVALKSSEGHCRKRKTRRVFVNRGGQLYETPTPSLERQQLKFGTNRGMDKRSKGITEVNY